MGSAAERQEFLGRLRTALVRAINGHPITVADAWDILREWDRATEATVADEARNARTTRTTR